MKIFIAGATGVLGRRVIPGLLAAGHTVVALSRSAANRELLARLGAEARTGDLFVKNDVVRLSADCDVIAHLATAIPSKARTTSKDWEPNDRIRREGTANLLAAAVEHGCRLYVQQSVAFLYGDRGGAWVDESSELPARQPTLLASAADMERLVAEANSRHRLPAVILRFGAFYSYDSSSTSAMFFGILKGRYPIIGNGKAYWNPLNVDDAADAILCAVAAPPPRLVYNICDDEPVPYGELIRYTAEQLGAPPPRHLPAFVARLAAGAEAVRFLLASVRCRNLLAKEELAWRPAYPTYREGVPAEIARWKAAAQQPPDGIRN